MSSMEQFQLAQSQGAQVKENGGQKFPEIIVTPPSSNHHKKLTSDMHRIIVIVVTLMLTFLVLCVTLIHLWTRVSTCEHRINRLEDILDNIQLNMSKQISKLNFLHMTKMERLETRLTLDWSDRQDSLWSSHQDDLNEIRQNLTLMETRSNKKINLTLSQLLKNEEDRMDIILQNLNQLDQKITQKTSILQNELVPIGFTYVQYGNQSEPTILWSFYQWTEVTSEYAGQFFRAEGGQAGTFNGTQDENVPRVTNIALRGTYQSDSVVLNVGSTSSIVRTAGSSGTWFGLAFTTSGGEVRPFNSAIKIWKRSG